MAFKEHSWREFYSPRNGRFSILACEHCGTAMSVGTKKIKCRPVSIKKRNARLRGWTMAKAEVEESYKLGK